MAAQIIYFSRSGENYVSGALCTLETGNTEVIAQMLSNLTKASLFRLEPVQCYSDDYNTCLEQALSDQRRNARPVLKVLPPKIAEADTLFLGFPNYWGTMPMPIFTFLEAFDFTGKAILPFCTHEGSGFGRSERDIHILCPGATIKPGLAVRGGVVCQAMPLVKSWLEHTRKEVPFAQQGYDEKSQLCAAIG